MPCKQVPGLHCIFAEASLLPESEVRHLGMHMPGDLKGTFWHGATRAALRLGLSIHSPEMTVMAVFMFNNPPRGVAAAPEAPYIMEKTLIMSTCRHVKKQFGSCCECMHMQDAFSCGCAAVPGNGMSHAIDLCETCPKLHVTLQALLAAGLQCQPVAAPRLVCALYGVILSVPFNAC